MERGKKCSTQTEESALGVREFFVAAMVTVPPGGIDEFLGRGEIGGLSRSGLTLPPP
jgi:hypothetical protein